jgi:biotin-dependent carboxylase-like uncharacterized protein
VTAEAQPLLEVVRAGLATTVQDRGRVGLGRFGVSPSGAMDPLAHRLANELLGNDRSAATLEVTGPGCEVVFLGATRFAIAGGDLDAALDGQPLDAQAAAFAPAGARLQFRGRRRGARASLAVPGGFQVAPVLSSASTDLGAGLGGVGGRPLRNGCKLAAPAPPAAHPARPPGDDPPAGDPRARLAPIESFYRTDPFVLRFVPEDDPGLPAQAAARFCSAAFRVSSRSGRTGYRFEGEPLPARPDPERLSEPTAPGAIQLPPDGFPILLMADRNTIGGYPRLGHLAAADQPRAAQLWPGDGVRFQPISLADAIRLARDTESTFQRIAATLR